MKTILAISCLLGFIINFFWTICGNEQQVPPDTKSILVINTCIFLAILVATCTIRLMQME
jgi:hypothetical protein